MTVDWIHKVPLYYLRGNWVKGKEKASQWKSEWRLPGSHISASNSKASILWASYKMVLFGKLVLLPKTIGNGLNIIEIERALEHSVK